MEAEMRRDLYHGTLLVSMIVVMASPAMAQQSGPGGRSQARVKAMMQRADQASRWWNRPELAKKIGLTAEQTSQLEELADETRELRRVAAGSYAASFARFLMALSAVEVDEAKVVARREAMEEDWANLFATAVNQLTAVRDILTAEQWGILREVHPAAMQLGQVRARGSGAFSSDGAVSNGAGEH
jgi:Spy/CpxP family protein refolding chaperone